MFNQNLELLKEYNELVLENSESIDKEYFDAIERDDMETIRRLVDMIEQRTGYNRKLFHGSKIRWYSFNLNKAGSNMDSGFLGKGIYLTNLIDIAEYHAGVSSTSGISIEPLGFSKEGNKRTIYKLAVKLQNPYMWGNKTLGAMGISFGDEDAVPIDIRKAVLDKIGNKVKTHTNRETIEDDASVAIREVLIGKECDGVIANVKNNNTTGIEVVVFSPNQIKSTDLITYNNQGDIIPLSQRFDSSKDDIRY